jgi:ATP-dependent RNA helicase DeaD
LPNKTVPIFAENYFMSNQFSDLGVTKEIEQSLEELQITVPTDIQKKCIPPKRK